MVGEQSNTGTESPDTVPVVRRWPSSGVMDPNDLLQSIRPLPGEAERAWQHRVWLNSSSLRGKRQSQGAFVGW
jgi:hypothetical protein